MNKVVWRVSNIKVYDKVAFFAFRGPRRNEGGNGKTFQVKLINQLRNMLENGGGGLITPIDWFPTIEKWNDKETGNSKWKSFIVFEEFERNDIPQNENEDIPEYDSHSFQSNEPRLTFEKKLSILKNKMTKFFEPRHEDLIIHMGQKVEDNILEEIIDIFERELMTDEEIYQLFFDKFVKEYEEYTGSKMDEDTRDKRFKQLQILERDELF